MTGSGAASKHWRRFMSNCRLIHHQKNQAEHHRRPRQPSHIASFPPEISGSSYHHKIKSLFPNRPHLQNHTHAFYWSLLKSSLYTVQSGDWSWITSLFWRSRELQERYRCCSGAMPWWTVRSWRILTGSCRWWLWPVINLWLPLRTFQSWSFQTQRKTPSQREFGFGSHDNFPHAHFSTSLPEGALPRLFHSSPFLTVWKLLQFACNFVSSETLFSRFICVSDLWYCDPAGCY